MSCLTAYLSLYQENKDLGTLRKAISPRLARLLTVKVTVKSSKPIEAIIDRGSQLNLILSIQAKELALQVNKLPNLIAEGINRGKLSIYGSTTVNASIIDSQGRVKVHRIPFVVADLRQYKMYLGLGQIN